MGGINLGGGGKSRGSHTLSGYDQMCNQMNGNGS